MTLHATICCTVSWRSTKTPQESRYTHTIPVQRTPSRLNVRPSFVERGTEADSVRTSRPERYPGHSATNPPTGMWSPVTEVLSSIPIPLDLPLPCIVYLIICHVVTTFMVFIASHSRLLSWLYLLFFSTASTVGHVGLALPSSRCAPWVAVLISFLISFSFRLFRPIFIGVA